MAERRPVAARTFFLNEAHEHAPGERDGFGHGVTFSGINWAAKGQRLAKTLLLARKAIGQTKDPLRDSRLFLVTRTETSLQRVSDAKNAKDGKKEEFTDLGGEHARIFERVGLDLIQITPTGDALVHAKISTIDQIEFSAAKLADAGAREQTRWAFLTEFHPVPMETRVDVGWLATLDHNTAHEVIFELQPVLTRQEFDLVSRVIRDTVAEYQGSEILGAGRDLSGRRWLRTRMRRRPIEAVAMAFQSVQSIHAPFRSMTFAGQVSKSSRAVQPSHEVPDVSEIPTVAIVDAGVPRQHKSLVSFRRGEYRHPESQLTHIGDHGSRVASRIVFGDLDARGAAFVPPTGTCRFLDVVVPAFSGTNGDIELDDKAILESM